jgi:hypothetical protein
MESGFSSLIDLVVTSSMGPGGILVAAARAGWKMVAKRVSIEPLRAFAESAEGKAFAADLKKLRADDIPAQLGKYLALDLRVALPRSDTGSAQAIIVFDSWEQFEERYPERRSRWYEEVQIVELFQSCRDFAQFVIAGQRAVSWLSDDRTLREGVDICFEPLQGLDRTEAAGYLRERRGIQSEPWIEALLEATA